MSRKLTKSAEERMRNELSDAYDFDPRDPLFGLTRQQLSGPKMERRTVLRLMAAAGTLTAWHLMPKVGGVGRAMAQGMGGTLTCGWSGVGEIVHPRPGADQSGAAVPDRLQRAEWPDPHRR